MDNSTITEYLNETQSIDYMNPIIQEKVRELKNQSTDKNDYIKRSYMFVRDEIPHSWDIGANVVSRTASDVLKNKTGIGQNPAFLQPFLEQITSHQELVTNFSHCLKLGTKAI